MSTKLSIDAILAESEQEVGRFAWEGSFADYLRMVIQNPSLSRLSHSLVHDAILAEGMEVSPEGEPSYGLFQGEMFGLEADLDRIVQYLDAAAQRMEVRKRILLLLGPPASGKSTVVDLIKRALERYTRRTQALCTPSTDARCKKSPCTSSRPLCVPCSWSSTAYTSKATSALAAGTP